MKRARKVIALVLCAILLMAASVMGTLAYLTSTATVENTFTAGNVTIALKEKAMDPETGVLVEPEALVDSGIQDIKIVPGRTIDKQPVVIVSEGSENCWLFVKVENGSDKDVLGSGAFTAVDGWTAVDGAAGWYKKTAVATVGEYKVFESFTFNNLSSSDVAGLAGGSIKVTAYAIQADGVDQDIAFDTARSMAN